VKVIIPAVGLLVGFLAGHGIETPPDLFLLLGTILVAYVSVGALEAYGSSQQSRPRVAQRQRLSTSHRA
jgi:hypothetical protein